LSKNPYIIFDDIEKKFPQFIERRLAAEKPNCNFDSIYASLKEFYSDEQISTMKSMEISSELKNVYGVTSIIEQIQPSDILIAETYLPEEIIKLFLQKAGFKGHNRIFVTTNGKSTGQLWNYIKSRGLLIKKHIGNNPVNDGSIPEKNGIPTKILAPTAYSPIEGMLNEHVGDVFANLIQHIRLSSPAGKNKDE
jgi:predicted HAD superfamily hydrolase